MSSPQAILAHLLEGREELVREVTRLTTAIAELDAVIGRVGGPGATDGLATPAAIPTGQERSAAPVQVETEPAEAGPTPDRAPARPAAKTSAKRPARKATKHAARTPARPAARKATKKAARTAPRASAGGGQKSIRVHVLEMLAAENRDWGLAEIIDRIHGAGIEAHDDAVRSITIKLMKDGRVERVGRGRYRLARRSRSAAKQSAPAAAPAPEPEPEAVDPAAAAPVTEDSAATTEASATAATAATSATPATPGPSPADEPQPAATADAAAPAAGDNGDDGDATYTPPLNLAEPWQSR